MIRAAIDELCRQPQVSALYSFGSRGRQALDFVNGTREQALVGRADLDIGARPQRRVRWGVEDKVRLALSLEDLFGCARVDLVVLPEADPFLVAEIIRGERLFAADEYDCDEYDLYVLRRAGDLAPLERERIELILQADHNAG